MNSLMNFRDFDTNPFRILDEVERDMRRMLDLMPARRSEVNTVSYYAPLCDFRDGDSHYMLSFDLPGVKKEDVKVELLDGKLHIFGERRNEFKEGDYTEKKYGHFERIISLPDGVEEENIEANYENGVLSLALPKAEKAQPKQITIGENKKDGIWSRLIGGKSKDEKESTVKVEHSSSKAA